MQKFGTIKENTGITAIHLFMVCAKAYCSVARIQKQMFIPGRSGKRYYAGKGFSVYSDGKLIGKSNRLKHMITKEI